MPTTLVRQVMTPLADVLAFHPEDRVEDAARAMAERSVGGAPVVDAAGTVVGLINDDDLIVQDVRLHAPTVLSVLGAYLELPSSQAHFEDDLRKAVGATVADVMSRKPKVCAEDDTLEQVATVMHEDKLRRLPVVREGKLVGIVARGDILRALVTRGPEG